VVVVTVAVMMAMAMAAAAAAAMVMAMAMAAAASQQWRRSRLHSHGGAMRLWCNGNRARACKAQPLNSSPALGLRCRENGGASGKPCWAH